MTIQQRFLFLLFGVFFCCAEEAQGISFSNNDLGIGDSVPRFEILLKNGIVLSTESLRGKRSLLLFFNTHCSECRKEFPKVERLKNQYPWLNIICIAREEENASIELFWKKHHLSLLCAPQKDANVYLLFAHKIIPRGYFVDSSGRIAAVFKNYVSWRGLVRKCKKLKER